MAVVVDEFEVVPGTPANQGAAPVDAQPQHPPPDPARAVRLHAS
jgi:hypothetical protein